MHVWERVSARGLLVATTTGKVAGRERRASGEKKVVTMSVGGGVMQARTRHAAGQDGQGRADLQTQARQQWGRWWRFHSGSNLCTRLQRLASRLHLPKSRPRRRLHRCSWR